jgi:UPF0176 protein
MIPPIPRTETRLKVQTFYHFLTLTEDEVKRIKSGMEELAEQLGISGLIILGQEGLNATASGPSETLPTFIREVGKMLSPGFEFSNIKSSWVEEGEKLPFLGFLVKVRSEIVTLKRPDLVPHEPGSATHISPDEWHKGIQDPDALIIDTRNNYETSIGTFRGAITPEIEEFSDFPDWLERNVVDKSKPTYIFCTGGIRCEKAIIAMEERGFTNVKQLDGGILHYIDRFPASQTNSLWDGECFVFDNRIAVDGDGRASQRYSACPHCGQPADHSVFCVRCDSPAVLCDSCFNEKSETNAMTCSKNCSYHWALHPGRKGRPQIASTLTESKRG